MDLDADYGYGPDTTKYVCLVCGYVYDPAEGDPAGGISPGISFGDLPASWRCPDCGKKKDAFDESRE